MTGGMRRLLVDETGTIWPAASLDLRRRLFCLTYDGDLTRDIVRNLGCIGVDVTQSKVSIVLHPRNVSSVAISSLLYWLADHNPKQICLSFAGDSAGPELIIGLDAATRRLGAIELKAQQDRRIKAQHLRLDQATLGQTLGAIFEFWRSHQGRCEIAQLIEIGRETLSGRCVAVAADDLRILELGEGLQIPDRRWIESARDQRLGRHPDAVYAHWVTECYRAVAESGRPDLADVKAEIFWPSSGRVHRTYRRLLMPCLNKAGQLFLFGANANRLTAGHLREAG
jgi:hypothetical protein